MGDQEVRYIHLKELFVEFIKRRPTSVLELVFKDEAGVKHKSSKFKEGDLVHWNFDSYVRAHACATLTIQRALFKISVPVAQIEIQFKPNEFRDYSSVELEDRNHRVTVRLNCGRSKSLADVTLVLGSQARTDLASKVLRFLKHPQLAALPPPTSKRGYNAQYPAIHWLNDDILLGIFDCYRLDDECCWNLRLGWRKLSHVCQRWRHLIHECASYLGLHIICHSGTPTLDMLDHLPPLPLFVDYTPAWSASLTEKDESRIYHALQSHDRLRSIGLLLPPSISHKVVMLLDEQFPILEHLCLEFSDAREHSLPPTLLKGFLAPNLRHLALPCFSPPRILWVLTSTVSLVTLKLGNIQTSSYFSSRVLAIRIQSLPQPQGSNTGFPIPIPRPSTERELLGEQGAPVTLPSLKSLEFCGVGAYLESLVAQIRAPLLERLRIALFNPIPFAFPHLFHLINTTEGFRFSNATVYFDGGEVVVAASDSRWCQWDIFTDIFRFGVPLERHRHIDYASQICHALIPALSGVERFDLHCSYTYIRNGGHRREIDGTTWHDLLRSFIGMKELHIDLASLEELSRALQMDEVGLDPGFLPNLRSICAARNFFTSFIDTRQVVGRPVQFVMEY